MIRISLLFIPLLLGIIALHPAAYSAAPVVDESENFALLDEQANSRLAKPVARQDNYPADANIALAHDDEPQNNEMSLLNKLKGMQQELQELRGQLEVQAHELNQLKQQQYSFYKDIDARLGGAQAAIASKGVAALNSTALPPAQHNSPAEEQINYLAAYDLVKTKQYDEALIAMQSFVTQYPQGGYTANAHYWLGELYMVKKRYPEAIDHFETVLRQFPASSKSAACSLKIGYALASSGRENEAKQKLLQVIRSYPNTPTAHLAATKLQTLSS